MTGHRLTSHTTQNFVRGFVADLETGIVLLDTALDNMVNLLWILVFVFGCVIVFV